MATLRNQFVSAAGLSIGVTDQQRNFARGSMSEWAKAQRFHARPNALELKPFDRITDDRVAQPDKVVPEIGLTPFVVEKT